MTQNEDGKEEKFTEDFEYYLPPSYSDFEKNAVVWARPETYLRELAYETEVA